MSQDPKQDSLSAQHGILGSAVSGGKLRFLSVSAIQKFDPTESGGCPRAWFFRYVLKKKEPETEALARGKQVATELEHYLKTGEDVLSPTARAGKHLLPAPGPDLEVEQPLGDINRAVKLREQGLHESACLVAGLSAGGVPLMGAADVRHRRGEYVDEEGEVRKDKATVEVIDHKTSSRINNHTTSGGKVYQGYAKTPAQVMAATQMVGYGVHAVRKYDVDLVRLSHIYYQTKNGNASAKRSGLISAEELVRRWDRVEAVARQIVDAAKETDPAKLDGNPDACTAYGRQCPHWEYCPRDEAQILSSFFSPAGNGRYAKRPGEGQGVLDAAMTQLQGYGETKEKETGMSIFNSLKKSTVAPATIPAPAAPPASVPAPAPASHAPPREDAERAAKIAAAKAQMEAEDRAAGLVPASIATVNPPDGPKPTLATAADPLPVETIASIDDAELRAKALSHAEAAKIAKLAAPAKAEPKAEEKTTGRCPHGGTRVNLTMELAVARKATCACGKVVALAPEKVGDTYAAEVKGHNIPSPEDKHAPTAEAPALLSHSAAPLNGSHDAVERVVAALSPERVVSTIVNSAPDLGGLAAREAAPALTQAPAPAQAAAPEGATIFVDVAVLGQPQPKPLADYYDAVVKIICDKGGALDLRCAPDGDLSHGKWRGVLTALVKARPLPPGEYSASSHDEIEMVVVQALSRSARVVRGVR